jgi:subtilisin-like proprotein convertase family protein
MRKITTLFASLFLVYSINAQELWTLVDNEVKLRSGLEREIIPTAYHTFKLDRKVLNSILEKAPMETDKNRSNKEVEVTIPMPDGSISSFYIYEAPVMAPGISKRYPGIKSYKGYNAAVPDEIIRFDMGSFGFHGAIRTKGGQIYIDPYARGDKEHYITYWVRDHIIDWDPSVPTCGVKEEGSTLNKPSAFGAKRKSLSIDAPLKTYRYAVTGTYRWSISGGRGTLERALADMNTSANRLNLIFENEAAIRLILVEDSDKLIFLDEQNQPFQYPNNAYGVLGQNTSVINNIIGSNSYDIGHCFGTCSEDPNEALDFPRVGGVASLSSACGGNKGAGTTCANGSVTGFTVRTVSHEIGHQFSATHVMNQCRGTENLSPGSGWEPGSGSTIMSYAGGCQSNNVQSFSDDYFHQGSLEQMYNFVEQGNLGGQCAELVETGNHYPEVNIPIENDLFIPISTPFELVGEATDEDGDVMTYNWDQKNIGPISPLGSPTGNAPSFRSWYPDDNPNRVLPRLNDLVGGISNQVEVLPAISRDFNFFFTARDNSPLGGVASWAELRFKSTDQAGPFLVTYPNFFAEFSIGDQLEITWDVANTDQPPVNTKFVDIDLSLDGGFTYPVSLLKNTPNDGFASVIVPNNATNRARIRVSAVDNIYFDISNRNFEIEEIDQQTFVLQAASLFAEVCAPDIAEFDLSTLAFNGYNEEVTYDIISGLPENASFSFSESTTAAGDSTILSIDLADVVETGSYEVEVQVTGADGQSLSRLLYLNVTATDFSELALFEPINGFSGATQAPEFTWAEDSDADSYRLEISDNPSFAPEHIAFSIETDDTNQVSLTILDPATVYYWRVKALNKCNQSTDEGFSEIFAFSTFAVACKEYEASNMPIPIASSGGGNYEAEIEVSDIGKLADINVLQIQGDHTRGGDLSGYLISPEGKEVLLWSTRCASQQNFDLGFDDESPNGLSCPINIGRIFRPQGSLADFAGDEINGTWKLQLRDTRSGNGGTYQNASFEICGNLQVDPPFLVTNKVLNVYNGERITVRNDVLKAEDNNNVSSEIIFTIVRLPSHGELQVNNMIAEVGMTFTQEDLDAERILYTNDINSDATQDDFTFTVKDPDGGWVPISSFLFDVKTVTSSSELTEDFVQVYPNPSSDIINVAIPSDLSDNASISVLDLNGRIVQRAFIRTANTRVNVAGLKQGIYILYIENGGSRFSKKVSIIR